MITGKKEELDKIAEEYCCPDHDNPLVVAWHAGENAYVIRCGAGHYPEEIKKKPSRTEQFKRGQLQKVDPDFNLLPTRDLATNEPLTMDKINGLVRYAERYGLDAYRGHVMLMYGQPYIGLDGYLYHANREKVTYQLKSRPLTTPERSDYQVEEGDHAWLAVLDIGHGEKYFTGLGIVKKSELTEMSRKKPDQLRYPVVANHPWQLAQKRAEWQVMRRGFPIGESPEVKEE